MGLCLENRILEQSKELSYNLAVVTDYCWEKESYICWSPAWAYRRFESMFCVRCGPNNQGVKPSSPWSWMKYGLGHHYNPHPYVVFKSRGAQRMKIGSNKLSQAKMGVNFLCDCQHHCRKHIICFYNLRPSETFPNNQNTMEFLVPWTLYLYW